MAEAKKDKVCKKSSGSNASEPEGKAKLALVFEAAIRKLPGKLAWPVFYVPASFTDAVGSKGRINVLATVDGAQFQGTLLPCCIA